MIWRKPIARAAVMAGWAWPEAAQPRAWRPSAWPSNPSTCRPLFRNRIRPLPCTGGPAPVTCRWLRRLSP